MLHSHAQVGLSHCRVRGVAPILFASIAEALVRMDTHKRNESHAPFLGNYSITSKLNCACKCDIALGLYCIIMGK